MSGSAKPGALSLAGRAVAAAVRRRPLRSASERPLRRMGAPPAPRAWPGNWRCWRGCGWSCPSAASGGRCHCSASTPCATPRSSSAAVGRVRAEGRRPIAAGSPGTATRGAWSSSSGRVHTRSGCRNRAEVAGAGCACPPPALGPQGTNVPPIMAVNLTAGRARELIRRESSEKCWKRSAAGQANVARTAELTPSVPVQRICGRQGWPVTSQIPLCRRMSGGP